MLKDIFKDIIENQDKEIIYNKMIKEKVDLESLKKNNTKIFKENDFIIKLLYEVFESRLKNKYSKSDNEFENTFKKYFILSLVDLREKIELNKNYENFNKSFYLLTDMFQKYINTKDFQFKNNIIAVYNEINKEYEEYYNKSKGIK